MKTRMNVTKKEAEQIKFNNGIMGICVKDKPIGLSIDGPEDFTFICCSNHDTLLDYEEGLYKYYEWRLTDIKDLKQGDVCKVIYNHLPKLYIYIFDKITEHYIDVGDEDYECKSCALMWGIEDNRPVKDYPFENVYKLFKKSDKK